MNDLSNGSVTSPSPYTEGSGVTNGGGDDEAVVHEDNEVTDTATSEDPEPKPSLDVRDLRTAGPSEGDSDTPPEWVEWRESSGSVEPSDATSDFFQQPATLDYVEPLSADRPPVLPNGDFELEPKTHTDNVDPNKAEVSGSTSDRTAGNSKLEVGKSSEPTGDKVSHVPSKATKSDNEN